MAMQQKPMTRGAKSAMAFATGLAALSATPVYAVDAKAYPQDIVTLIVPFAAGGMVDASARILAERLGQQTGQQFIVENRPGASGNIGYASASRAEADGYTLLLGYGTTSTCNPSVFPALTWKAEDLTPIAAFAEFPMVITVNADLPPRTLGELVDYLKAHPDEVNYGSVGIGSQVHIATETLKHITGTDMMAVQYKGSGEVITDLLSGTLQLVFDAVGPYRQHVAAGALRSLAVAAEQRDPGLPEVPTTAEAGFPDLLQIGFMPVYAPMNTDPAIVSYLAEQIQIAAQDDAFKEKLSAVNLNVNYRAPDDLTPLLAKMSQDCADVVKNSGISLE